MWCDHGEWEALKATNLHDDIHDIVTQHWQAAVRESSVQNEIEQTYARNLGANYAKAQEIKAWLRAQPQKSLILAYLADTKIGTSPHAGKCTTYLTGIGCRRLWFRWVQH